MLHFLTKLIFKNETPVVMRTAAATIPLVFIWNFSIYPFPANENSGADGLENIGKNMNKRAMMALDRSP